MKRLVICCDGTWNTLDAKYPTNVAKISRLTDPVDQNGIRQIVHYDDGVGTGKGVVSQTFGRLTAGAFGWGLMDKVESAYRFLCKNYEAGDEI